MQSPRHVSASAKGLILFSFIRFTSARYGPIRALEANSAWGADKICRRPPGDPQGDIGALRDALHELMWKASASSATERDCAAPRPRSLLAGGSPGQVHGCPVQILVHRGRVVIGNSTA